VSERQQREREDIRRRDEADRTAQAFAGNGHLKRL
jgi:hypothetical protein